jgi:hypothetical protein
VYVGGFPPDIRNRRGFVVIRDETKRVRQPVAWLLLSGVTISVFLGLVAIVSTGGAAAANAGALIALTGGGTAGSTFADRAVVASHELTSLPLTAMAVVAVILATHIGGKVPQARRITLFAVVLQGIALVFGVLTWLLGLGIQASSPAKLGFFLDGGVGVMIAVAGLFFSVVTLRSAELQVARQHAAPQQAAVPPGSNPSATGYPGYGYGQPVLVQQATAPAYPRAGYQSGTGQQTPSQQAAAQTARYQTPAGQQAADQRYGAGAGHPYGQQSQAESPQSQTSATHGQQADQRAAAAPAYGSYGPQASQPQDYQAGYSQLDYGQGYDAGYGQGQSYGQGYGSYGQQRQHGYGQQARQGSDTYRSPSTDTYQHYYRQQSPERGSAEAAQSGHGLDARDSRDRGDSWDPPRDR